MKTISALFCVLVFSQSGLAQAGDCSTRTVVVSAMSAQGKPIRNLTADYFQNSPKAGAPQVRSLRSVERGHLVILLDVSNSMRGEKKLKTALGMAVEAVRGIPANWKVELVLFGETVKEHADVSANRGEITSVLSDLLSKSNVGGRTALLDAIQQSLTMFADSSNSRAILLVTDAGDNASRASVSKLERALLQHRIRLFVAALPDPVPYRYRKEAEETYRAGYVLDLVEASGGAQRLWELDRDVTTQEVRDFVGLISIAYVLDVQLTTQVDRPIRWKLDLTPDAKMKWEGLTMLYPWKILPCESMAATK